MLRISVIAVIAFLCCAPLSFAHAPSRMETNYDPVTSAVSVVVYHDVKDPKTHYIKKISVLVNGAEVIQDEYSQQSNNMNQPAVYEYPDLNPGDVVTLKASCNIAGSASADVVVPK